MTENTQPTVAELEQKVGRLAKQVEADQKAAEAANSAFASAVKSGNVDRALELADERTARKTTAAKSVAQHKTATNAVASATRAANAGKIARVHDIMRDDKAITGHFTELESYGITRLVIERSEEGKLIINSAGPTIKRSGGGGGGGKGQPITVDGTEFASAAAALAQFRPDFTGKMGVSAIRSWLTNAGHEVS